MRSRLGRMLAAKAAARVAASMAPEQAKAALAVLRKVKGPAKPLPAVSQQQPQAEATDKLRAAVHELTPEQATSLPRPLAVAVLEVLGHKVS